MVRLSTAIDGLYRPHDDIKAKLQRMCDADLPDVVPRRDIFWHALDTYTHGPGRLFTTE